MNQDVSRESTNSQILAEASEWLVEFETGEPDTETRRRFDDWLRRSPEHVRAYLGLLPLWKQGAVAKYSPDRSPEQLVAYALTEGNVVPLGARQNIPNRALPGIRGGIVKAAAVIVVVLGGLFAWLQVRAPTYTTGIAEQHSLLLPDGSTIELNARTKVRIDFTEKQRGIALLQGQALFHVMPDKHRPFVVHAGSLSVRAVGTQFDVNRMASGTVVTVVEGRVTIGGREGSLLSAGQQVTLSSNPTHPAKQVRPANLAAATAWTQRRLVFDASTLSEVAEEFNRYNAKPIVIDDAALDRFPISGSFSSTDSASLLRFLEAQPHIEVVSSDDEIRIALRK
jgi:transmembrane sensor